MEQSRGTPETAVAEPAVTSSAASVADSSLKAQVQKANSPQEIRALAKQVLTQKPAEPGPTPPKADPLPGEIPAAETAETTVSEETPAEETPVAENEEAASAEADGGDAEDEGDGGDGPVSPVTSKRTHLRLADNDQVGRLAASFMKRNRDMPMSEALAKANAQLGIKPAETPSPEAAKPKSDLPPTVEAVDSAIEGLEAQRARALVALEFEEVAKIDSSMRKLDRHRLNLEKDAEKQQTKQARDYEQGFAASEARAVELYEFAANPDSAGAKRMMEIEADLKANEDPLFHSPDKPLRIAQMVAAELKIAPKRKGAPAAPAKAAVPATVAPKKGVVPAGTSRTVPATTNQQPAINSEIQAVRNIGDLRKLRQKMGLPM